MTRTRSSKNERRPDFPGLMWTTLEVLKPSPPFPFPPFYRNALWRTTASIAVSLSAPHSLFFLQRGHAIKRSERIAWRITGDRQDIDENWTMESLSLGRDKRDIDEDWTQECLSLGGEFEFGTRTALR